MTKKALFLDRDGVICHMVKYLDGFDSPQQVKDVILIQGIENIIKYAQSKGLFVIEISNQPSVAKGKQTPQKSAAIETKVHNLLSQVNVKIDSTYICPHHPQGVIPKLTIECDCRKPKPGLLHKAADKFNIDLSKSLFLGDNASDVEAAKAAGCKSIVFIHNEDELWKLQKAKDAQADYKIKNLYELIRIIEALN